MRIHTCHIECSTDYYRNMMSNRMPDRLPDRILNNMSNRVPDGMSEIKYNREASYVR